MTSKIKYKELNKHKIEDHYIFLIQYKYIKRPKGLVTYLINISLRQNIYE